MKSLTPYLVFIAGIFLLTPVFAASETLTTYYPAPSGNYNRISTNTLEYVSNTLANIQAQLKCSYDPATGWPPCPAGIVFYNTDAHALYVSDGLHWGYLNATCIANNPCTGRFNCGTDDCGVSCGACLPPTTCSIAASGTAGICR